MNGTSVRHEIERAVREVAAQNGLTIPDLKDDLEIVDDLGFTSLAVAALIASLEEVLGVDPFQEEDVMITDIRTVKDLCDVYAGCLN